MSDEEAEALCERLVWECDPEGLARTGPCDGSSWAGSIQRELVRYSTMPDLGGEPGPFPPYSRCAALAMIKDEADIIGANLAWLFHLGLRRFVIMDNNSTDGTHDELRRFEAGHPQAQLVMIRDDIVAHYQAEKTSFMARLAQSTWADLDWLLPVDADEFCIARRGFYSLAYVPAGVHALTIPKTIHFLRAGSASHSKDVLARMPVRSGVFIVPPKVIMRARPDIGVTQGNHKASGPDGMKLRYAGGFHYGLYHREFQTRSFAQFLRKVRNGGAAILAARAQGRGVGGEHWMAWYDVLTEQGEAGLRAVFDAECFREPGLGFVVDPFSGVRVKADT